MLTAKDEILKHLFQFGVITPKTAYSEYYIMRLAVYIGRLRNEGYRIETFLTPFRTPNGREGKFGTYYIDHDIDTKTGESGGWETIRGYIGDKERFIAVLNTSPENGQPPFAHVAKRNEYGERQKSQRIVAETPDELQDKVKMWMNAEESRRLFAAGELPEDLLHKFGIEKNDKS